MGLAAPVMTGLAAGVAFVATFAFFTGSNILPLQRNYDSTIIILERTVCYGTCPDYSITIHGNGTVIYEVRRYVAVTGKHTSQIPSEKVQELVNYFHKAGYFSMNDRYSGNVGDVPTITTSIKLDRLFKKVVDYYNPPPQLTDLENLIDSTAGSANWVKCPTGEQVASREAGGCMKITN
ncbi:MAG TPA: DUF6438 domain-containing protein [Nitrososphaera sp.]|nr:DUF6438 domain-containing protein [Nitrososphaera sp.]